MRWKLGALPPVLANGYTQAVQELCAIHGRTTVYGLLAHCRLVGVV